MRTQKCGPTINVQHSTKLTNTTVVKCSSSFSGTLSIGGLGTLMAQGTCSVHQGGLLTAAFVCSGADSWLQAHCSRRIVHAKACSSPWNLRRPLARPPWLPPAGARFLEAAVDTGDLTQQSVDELWWEEGAPVQSLQIACKRDAKGDDLDPWRLSELLMDIGAMSVSVDDADHGTKDETPLLDDHPASKAFDPSIPPPSISGRKEMWGASSRVVALFPKKWDIAVVVASVEEALELASPLSFKVDDVADEDWVKTVQEGWDPIEVGRLRIRFPWHPALPPSQLRPDQVELELEGGRAFGTGEHPTTSLCCTWLQDNVSGQRVLDYGSGSGILGLAALSFGATEAIGVEIDLEAIASAAVNAANNGLKMDTYFPQEVDTGGGIDLILTKLAAPVQETAEPSENRTGILSVADGLAISKEKLGKFDVTVANILAAPIIKLEPIFAYFTRPGGKLALSGMLEEQADAVVTAYANDFDITRTERLGGWVLLSGVRRGG